MTEWIAAAEQSHPARGYQLRAGQLRELTEAAEGGDLARSIAAAYNAGFKRGRNYERNHRPSMAKVKAAVLWDADNIETRQSLLDLYREQLDHAETAELLANIIQQTEEYAATAPEFAADMQEWTLVDRILWNVKEAYCRGMIAGQDLQQEAIRSALKDLE